MRNISWTFVYFHLQAQFSSLEKADLDFYSIYFVLYGHIERDFCFLSERPLLAFQRGEFKDNQIRLTDALISISTY